MKGFHVTAGMRQSPVIIEYSQFPYVQLQDFWRLEMHMPEALRHAFIRTKSRFHFRCARYDAYTKKNPAKYS
jgi:hypothetical protein